MKQQSHFVKNFKSLHKCWTKLNQTRCLNKKIQLKMIRFLFYFFRLVEERERKRDRHGHVWLAWRPGGDWNSSDRPRGLLVFRVCTTSLLRWGRSSSSSLEKKKKKNWNAEWRIWSNVTVDFPATVRIFFFFFFFPPVRHFFSYLSEKTLIFFIFLFFKTCLFQLVM